MYIWIGCRLPEEFEQSLRKQCIPIAQELSLDTVAFSLPQHISLKISFDSGTNYEQLLDFLQNLLRNEPQFYVIPKVIERQGSILWITFRENGQLQHLHNLLDQQLKLRFGIPQHPFDQAFAFHSTLFFGSEQALDQAKQALHDFPMPDELWVKTILLGISETGKPGSYRIIREILL